jgi:hypothetical protein
MDISLHMKLFRRTGTAKAHSKAPATSVLPPEVKEIALSSEQKTILLKPVDPRVDRILEELYADRATAERALKKGRVIEFPQGTSSEAHVVQDKNGFWRIVPAVPEDRISALDAL